LFLSHKYTYIHINQNIYKHIRLILPMAKFYVNNERIYNTCTTSVSSQWLKNIIYKFYFFIKRYKLSILSLLFSQIITKKCNNTPWVMSNLFIYLNLKIIVYLSYATTSNEITLNEKSLLQLNSLVSLFIDYLKLFVIYFGLFIVKKYIYNNFSDVLT